MSEERPPTGNTPSDLRSLIAETLADTRKETDDPNTAGAAPAAGDDGAAAAADRGEGAAQRQPSGGTAEGAGAPSGGEPQPPAATEGPSAAAAEPGAAPPRDTETAAPQHWAAQDKSTFDALPSAAKKPFLDLYRRMEAGLTPRLQRAADLEREWSDVEQLFAPWRQVLQQQGRTPKDVVRIWHDVERGLSNRESQDEIIANIIHGYGADPVRIAQFLNRNRGFAPPVAGAGDGYHPNGGGQPSGGGQPAPQTRLDPALAARLEALEVDRNLRLQNEQRAHLEAAHQQYTQFAEARDAAGNLLHPHVAVLEPQMAILLQLDRAQGKTSLDLQDLYDRAAWADPSTRERLLVSQREDEARRAAEDRKAKSDAARRASASVTGAPGPGQAPQDLGAPERTIRDDIRAQLQGGRR